MKCLVDIGKYDEKIVQYLPCLQDYCCKYMKQLDHTWEIWPRSACHHNASKNEINV